MKKLLLLLILLLPTQALAVGQIPMTPDMKKDFNSLTADLACLCGCGTTVYSCPHVTCGFAVPVRKNIREMMKDGLSRKEIVAKLVSTHGEAILAKPTFTGFNLMAWITPFIAILLMAISLVVLIKGWATRRKTPLSPASGLPAGNLKENDPYLKRMREELDHYYE